MLSVNARFIPVLQFSSVAQVTQRLSRTQFSTLWIHIFPATYTSEA